MQKYAVINRCLIEKYTFFGKYVKILLIAKYAKICFIRPMPKCLKIYETNK